MLENGITCKGSYYFNSACGNCEKCFEDLKKLINSEDWLKNKLKDVTADSKFAEVSKKIINRIENKMTIEVSLTDEYNDLVYRISK